MPGSPTTPGWTDTRVDAPVRIAFRDYEHVGTREFQVFAAQWLAYALSCRRFAVTLAGANARLGADVDRYSFIVVDLHHQLLAGLCRRTAILEFRNAGAAQYPPRRPHSVHLAQNGMLVRA